MSEYSEIVFQKYNGLCATWNHATTYSTKSDYSDTLLDSLAKLRVGAQFFYVVNTVEPDVPGITKITYRAFYPIILINAGG